MKNYGKFITALSGLFVITIFTLSFTGEVSASHYRYGHLYYERDPVNCDSVTFTLVNAFRRSGYAPNYNVGDVFTETIGATQLFFGDGNATPVLQYKVIAVDIAENYLIARALQPGSLTKESISYNYSGSAGSFFLAEINTTARTAIEINHPSEPYRISALLWKGNCSASPRSSMPPIVNVVKDPASTVIVPAINFNPNKYLKFRYATPVEMGVSGSNPFPAFGGAGSINPATGRITWNTTTGITGGLYSTQVIIEERDVSTDTIVGRVAVDWLTQILNCPDDSIKPVFVPPTPASGTIILLRIGVPVSFTVKAIDNSPGLITLSSTGLPPGATMTPVLPTAGNPVSAVFNFTPTTLFFSFVLTFTATDSCDNQGIYTIFFDTTLPVELSSFSTVTNNNNVTLNWLTSSETNNSGFEIERATGSSEQWSSIGTVQGNGNSTVSNSYSFADRGLNLGTYNYRLKQIDFNGNFTYHNLSSEVVIGVPTRFELSQNYPNPFNPSTKIDFVLPNDGNVNLSVYDNSGKEVSTLTSGFKTAGYYTIDFNASNLSSGIYFYKIQFSFGDQSFAKVMKMALLK